MRERENLVGFFEGQRPVDPDEDVRIVGGAGIFQIYEPKEKFKRKRMNRKVQKWRILSIRAAKKKSLDERAI